MRDGTPLFVRGGLLTSFINMKRIPKEPDLSGKTKEEINKVIVRRYIAGGQVIRMTSYFNVPTRE